jgi:hypothetical protein
LIHDFRRFCSSFGEKNGVFLENQCYDQFLGDLGRFGAILGDFAQVSAKNSVFLENQ